jgi:hypothetical protein
MTEKMQRSSDARKRAVSKYDASHTKQIKLKLNLETDKDILERLDEVENKQGYIKALIRSDIKRDILRIVEEKRQE